MKIILMQIFQLNFSTLQNMCLVYHEHDNFFSFLFMNSSQEQVDQPDYQKEKIECADFSALEWKLTGVQVNPKIVRILKELN